MTHKEVRLACVTLVLVAWSVIDFLANLWETQDHHGWDVFLTVLLIGWSFCCWDLKRSDG